jgi:hypothetical protein
LKVGGRKWHGVRDKKVETPQRETQKQILAAYEHGGTPIKEAFKQAGLKLRAYR